MTTQKGGVPKGTVNNLEGANQYAPGKGLGEKNSRLYLRLSESDKRKLKAAAQKKGMTLTSWLLEIALKAAQ
jgi:predicted DNA binding CopG/RHH family protein